MVFDVLTLVVSVAAIVMSGAALYVNGRGVKEAARSADEATRSADAAEKSADAADESVGIVRSERDRAIERADVVWKQHPRRLGGVQRITNAGHDTAYGVEAVVYVNGQRRLIVFGDVDSGGNVEIDLKAESEAAEREAAERNARFSSDGMVFISSPELSVSTRLTWTSALGTSDVAVLGEN